ncbi:MULTISPECIES: helix-turn-helix domain-containing protein [unclassified Streptomyces]|uniref:helix-turn-helix domain-containing protein n=1 Tax=unclassified Streptomyces TaxID=2593676 RepID=UPI00278BB429|nr:MULTISPECIES: helix-turn-helix domain-containing protein [unclassified Streptomyces]
MTNPSEPDQPGRPDQPDQPDRADRPRPANQGRRVAARNRAALIAAAREVFAEHGLNAPLSSVARRAGVGQGSLYRHFADRVALASAVLDENVRQIERAAAEPDASLTSVLGVVTWHITRSTAFVDLLRVRGNDEQGRELSARVRAVLDGYESAGRGLGADELMLAIAMVSGAVAGPTLAERERLARAAWGLLGIEVGPLRSIELVDE